MQGAGAERGEIIRYGLSLSFRRLRLDAVRLLAGAMLCAAAASVAADYAAAMRLTVDGWLASQTTEGLFPYGFDFLADAPLEPDRMSPANLIRQAGSTFGLALYYQYSRDPAVQAPLRRAIGALGQRSLPIGKSQAQHWIEGTRILSLPFARWKLRSGLDRFGLLYKTAGDGKIVSPDGGYAGASAGTVALSLLAELNYEKVSGDRSFAELRQEWLRGLLILRIPGGGFRANPTSVDDSHFYNGEGWLALAVYRNLHPDDANAASAVEELDLALIERYSRNPNPSFYHWGAMAAAQRHATTGDARFLEFLQDQGRYFVNRLRARLNAEDNNCADMEGVAATLAVLKRSANPDAELAERMRSWLSSEAAKLPRLQIQPGQTGMALAGEAQLHAPRMARFPGAFLAGLYRPTIRVDGAQHCLSAMIMIERDALLQPK